MAINLQDQMTRFHQLPYETRKTKVLDMLYKLQTTHATFAMLYEKLHTVAIISDSILANIYQGIFEVAEELEKGNKTAAEEKIKHMGEVLLAIKRQEEMEMAREGNPDDLLKSL